MNKPRLLTKRERAQLERAQALLEKIFEESCEALDVDQDDGLDEPVAGPAKRAEVKVYELLEDDERERRSWEAHQEREAFMAAVDNTFREGGE